MSEDEVVRYWPPAWFVEALSELAMRLVEHGADPKCLRVTLDEKMALAVGCAPGGTVKIHTAAGYVAVSSPTRAEPSLAQKKIDMRYNTPEFRREVNRVYDSERRALPRTPCVHSCNLAVGHAGPHRGACGCNSGCKAEGCPNL